MSNRPRWITLLPLLILLTGSCTRRVAFRFAQPLPPASEQLPAPAKTEEPALRVAGTKAAPALPPVLRQRRVVSQTDWMHHAIRPHQRRTTPLFRSLHPAARRSNLWKMLSSRPQPVKDEGTAYFNMGALFALGGIVIAVAGILLAFGLEFSLLGVLALLGGLATGLFALFAAVFSVTAQNKTRSRFNMVTVGGLLLLISALALGWHLGGLIGVGVGLLLAGVGALITGFSLTLGNETGTPATPPK